MFVKQKRPLTHRLQPVIHFDNNNRGGDGKYLKHLLAFLEALEPILEKYQ